MKVIYVENGEQIIRNLKEQELGDAETLIWIMPEAPTEDLINTLNNFRELFYEAKIPHLMFYNQAFSESVIRKAPDFWRYRGNYYELEEVGRGMAFEAIETLATPFSYQDKEDLLRRKRINEYLLEKVRDKEEKTKILSELGTIFYYLGELDNALEYFRKVLKLNEELGKKEGIATDLVNIGIIHQTKGELDNALEYFGKALKLHEELGRKEGIANQLGNIGNVNLNKGEHEKALGYYEKALRIFKDIGMRIETAQTLMNIGDVFTQKGDKKQALDCYSEAKDLAKGSPVFEDVSKRLNKLKEEQNA